MKRIRAEVEITRRTYVEFEVDNDLDDQTMNWLQVLIFFLSYCNIGGNVISSIASLIFRRGHGTMNAPVTNAATTPIPVQLSATECTACLFPHLSRPKRGPKGKIGYHRLFNLILWVLYTGMQWTCLPIPTGPTGKPEIHDTNVYRAFAKWADDGSLQQAFIARVSHLSEEKPLDLSVLHGDGTNTVAQKGAMGSATRARSPRRESRSSP
jgi:transposase